MLACRQEFAVMVATFAFLPPREPENPEHDPEVAAGRLLDRPGLDLVRLLRLSQVHGRPKCTRTTFIDQFLGPKASVLETLGPPSRS